MAKAALELPVTAKAAPDPPGKAKGLPEQEESVRTRSHCRKAGGSGRFAETQRVVVASVDHQAHEEVAVADEEKAFAQEDSDPFG